LGIEKGNLKKTFTVIIERDPESGWLVGKVMELLGGYSQAPDLSTLEADMKGAITVYLQTRGLEEQPLSSVFICTLASGGGGCLSSVKVSRMQSVTG
jgi:predicted RNase H-like HicB family nuclease